MEALPCYGQGRDFVTRTIYWCRDKGRYQKAKKMFRNVNVPDRENVCFTTMLSVKSGLCEPHGCKFLRFRNPEISEFC